MRVSRSGGRASGLPRSRRRAVGATVLAATLALSAGAVLAATGKLDNPWPYAGTEERSPLLAVVGDISCQPGEPVETELQKDVCNPLRNQAQAATANQIENLKPDLVPLLGDMQYQVGRYEDFLGSFDKTYGAFKFLQRPAPGNHEFYDRDKKGMGETGVNGAGYFDYYNGFQLNPDGTPVTDAYQSKFVEGASFTQPRPRQDGQAGHVGSTGDGWYSYDLGSWHIISLNEECANQPGGCDPNGEWFSRETQWLAQDLRRSHNSCTVAYWHHPTFTVAESEPAPEGAAAGAWWKLLYQNGADLVLNGHDHTYARYAPVDPDGQFDREKGIREFIVGTGGESLDPPVTNANTPNLQAASGDYYGVMGLRLDHNGYRWDFESSLKNPDAASGTPASYSDTGRAKCHRGHSDRD